MSFEALSAREMISRLVARVPARSDPPGSTGLPIQAVSERTYRALARSLGATGARALLTRALTQAQDEHPVLREIRIDSASEAGLERVTEAVQAHGAAAVTAGLEAVLEMLLGLLGRLIGNDMVAQLVEQSAPGGTQDDEDVK